MSGRAKNIAGKQFGVLKVLSQVPVKGAKCSFWYCSCICGSVRTVRANSLKQNTWLKCVCGHTSPAWKGVGKVPHSYWSSVRSGAIRQGKRRTKVLEFSVTLDYISQLFELQQGKCAFTGVELRFRVFGNSAKSGTASLDRIDSSKGYIPGNVQCIHKTLQSMKGSIPDNLFRAWCLAVTSQMRQSVT